MPCSFVIAEGARSGDITQQRPDPNSRGLNFNHFVYYRFLNQTPFIKTPPDQGGVFYFIQQLKNINLEQEKKSMS
jgi:hypothetical protein